MPPTPRWALLSSLFAAGLFLSLMAVPSFRAFISSLGNAWLFFVGLWYITLSLKEFTVSRAPRLATGFGAANGIALLCWLLAAIVHSIAPRILP